MRRRNMQKAYSVANDVRDVLKILNDVYNKTSVLEANTDAGVKYLERALERRNWDDVEQALYQLQYNK